MTNNNIIPPEIYNDEFSDDIIKIVKNNNLNHILEIGSSNGEGSTTIIITAILNRSFFSEVNLLCLEASIERFKALKKRFQDFSFVKCYNSSSIKLEEFPSEEKIKSFYNNIKSNLNKFSEQTIISWLHEDKNYLIKNNIKTNAIEDLKENLKIQSFDFVLIDGSEFTGEIELSKVIGSKFIALDDIETYKNYLSHKTLMKSKDYSVLKINTKLRNGYSIFRLNE
tara:strand:- start:381 stop:1055 length:675 start_codon:yes stop_codon:yes gene_type:complete